MQKYYDKSLEYVYSMRAVGYVNKVKDSWRYQLRFYIPPLYQLSYRRKSYEVKCLRGRTYLMENARTWDDLLNSITVFSSKQGKKTS